MLLLAYNDGERSCYMPKNKMKSGTFIAMCVVTVLFIVMPLFLQVSVIRNAIAWILSGLKYQEYKSAYLGLVGGLLGSWLAITGAIYTQHKFDREKEEKRAIEEKRAKEIDKENIKEICREMLWSEIRQNDNSLSCDNGNFIKAIMEVKTSIAILNAKLGNTNDDKKRNLFQAMKDMLQYMDEKTSEKQFYFGTDNFDYVWEKLIDRAFGEKDKEKYFPRSRWLLDYGKYKEKRPLMPDTIMIYNGKYYILDAKCYKYGWTGIPDHLPNGSSINKQITYGEYLEKYKGVDTNSLFNAFIMPYNMDKNYFKLTSVVGNIGEAVGDWRENKKYYERIQGIVMDTRYLMYHYTGNPVKEKVALADCIEAVLKRKEVPTAPGAVPATPVHKPVVYDFNPRNTLSMVAEEKAPYGNKEN